MSSCERQSSAERRKPTRSVCVKQLVRRGVVQIVIVIVVVVVEILGFALASYLRLAVPVGAPRRPGGHWQLCDGRRAGVAREEVLGVIYTRWTWRFVCSGRRWGNCWIWEGRKCGRVVATLSLVGVGKWFCVFLKQRQEIVIKRGQSSRWEIKRHEIVAGGAVAVHGHAQYSDPQVMGRC